MSTLDELLAQQADIEKKIKEAKKSALSEAIASARAIIEKHGLTAADVFPGGKSKASGKSGSKVAPKYRDNATGSTWSGRGIAPKWLAGKNKADYLIA
ncbi:MAG: H-NS histone family protein [Burkholderiaceae bacterium]